MNYIIYHNFGSSYCTVFDSFTKEIQRQMSHLERMAQRKTDTLEMEKWKIHCLEDRSYLQTLASNYDDLQIRYAGSKLTFEGAHSDVMAAKVS